MINLKNISKIYENKDVGILNISLKFPFSGLYIIEGPSGCGKTTLLNIIGGLINFNEGSYSFCNEEIHKMNDKEIQEFRNKNIGYIFQDYKLYENLTVYENLKVVNKSENVDSKIDELLCLTKLENFKNSLVCNLSGGQKQRVAIVRSLVNNPKVILADEPTGNLDTENGKVIMSLLKEISKDILVICISHNSLLNKEYSENIITMDDGKVINNTSTDNVDKSLGIVDDNVLNNELNLKKVRKGLFKDTRKDKSLFILLQSIFVVFLMLCGSLALFNKHDAIYKSIQFSNEVTNVRLDYKYQDDNKELHFSKGLFFKDIVDQDNCKTFITENAVYYVDHPLITGRYQEEERTLNISSNFNDIELIEGYLPLLDNDILVSDIFYSEISHYNQTIYIGSQRFNICGVYSTKHINIKQSYQTAEYYNNYVINNVYINNIENISKSSVYVGNVFADNEDEYIKNKIEVKSSDDKNCLEGRLPTKENEIAISSQYFKYLNNKNILLNNEILVFNAQQNINRSDEFTLDILFDKLIVVGIIESESNEIYFQGTTYNEIYENVIKYFCYDFCTISLTKNDIINLDKLGFEFKTAYSYLAYDFNDSLQAYKAIIFVVTIFSLAVLALIYFKTYLNLINNNKEQFVISFVLGIKKDEIKKIVILEYMKSVLWCNLIAVIPSVLGLFILNYFSCKFDSSIQFISYNPFMISVIIILQSLVTYIFWNKTINEIELNNLFGWMKRGQ